MWSSGTRAKFIGKEFSTAVEMALLCDSTLSAQGGLFPCYFKASSSACQLTRIHGAFISRWRELWAGFIVLVPRVGIDGIRSGKEVR